MEGILCLPEIRQTPGISTIFISPTKTMAGHDGIERD